METHSATMERMMSPSADLPSVAAIREMLELALSGLDRLGLEQAALHVSLALHLLRDDPQE